MNRGMNPHKAPFAQSVHYFAAFLGGGAAANCTLPADGVLTDAAAGLYPRQCNLGLTATYVSTGVYTIVLAEACKNLLFASGIVVSDGASPTATLTAEVTKITPPTGLTVKILGPTGTLTDLGTSDLLILKIDAADTGSVNGTR